MNQKGVTLFLTIMILSIILAIVFGLSAILISQIRTIKKMGDSVAAFYAADTGTEQALKDVLVYVKAELATPDGGIFFFPSALYSGSINLNGSIADYSANVSCCCSATNPDCIAPVNPDCYFDEITCPLNVDIECRATFFCIKSIGIYPIVGEKTKRAIETQIFPSE